MRIGKLEILWHGASLKRRRAEEQARRFKRAGMGIAAIKHLRSELGLTLKEAKDEVDKL